MIEMQVEGMEDLNKNLDKFIDEFKKRVPDAVDKGADKLAQNIQLTFRQGTVGTKISFKPGEKPAIRNSRSGRGFHDVTGELRGSIRGGVSDELSTGDKVIGFVGAGDDSIGSDGKKTRDYVAHVEFGEFSRAGDTSFLRPGVEENSRQFADYVVKQLDLDSIMKSI